MLAPRLLSPAHLEGEFGVKAKTALSLVKHDVLPAVRVGRRVFFDRSRNELFTCRRQRASGRLAGAVVLARCGPAEGDHGTPAKDIS